MTLPKPSVKRSDVVLVLFPDSDLSTAKTRPALIEGDGGIAARDAQGIIIETAIELNHIPLSSTEVKNLSVVAVSLTHVIDIVGI